MDASGDVVTDQVTRLRRGSQTGTDAFHQPVYGPDSETALPEGLFAPGGSTEPVEPGRTPVVTVPTLYWRNEWPDVVSTDRLRVRGTVFEVQGEPADWRPAGDGGPGGLVVQLRDSEG